MWSPQLLPVQNKKKLFDCGCVHWIGMGHKGTNSYPCPGHEGAQKGSNLFFSFRTRGLHAEWICRQNNKGNFMSLVTFFHLSVVAGWKQYYIWKWQSERKEELYLKLLYLSLLQIWQMVRRKLECIEVIGMKESIQSLDTSGQLIFTVTQSHELKVKFYQPELVQNT